MKNSEYWENRIANETWKIYNSIEERNRDLMEIYQEASLDIQEELYKIAVKVDKGQGATLSDMHKYNRLAALRNNIENRIRDLGETVEKFGIEGMKLGIKKNYSAVMKALEVDSFDVPNERLMNGLINAKWYGGNYSTRLWQNTQVLVSNLNQIITIGLTQGKTITEMAIQLNNRMNKGFNASHRLVRTETMKVLNDSSLKAYKDSNLVKKVQWWAAADERMCEECGALHGKIFEIDKVPYCPKHSGCRCTYIPIIT